jgi:WD domain, G-beta repeat
MDADELREAISRPAEDAGHPFDPALVELLVQDTVGREGALPLLQFALQRLWEAMRKGKDPTETLQAIGGVGGALAQEADQLYDSMSQRQKRIARRAFRSMVHLGESTSDTRRRVDLDSIVSKDESRDDVLDVLRAFAQPSKRLVTLEGNSGDVLAEVTHEALIARWDKLREWLGPEQREDERFRRRLAEAAAEWGANGRRFDLLWGGFTLGRLREFAKRTDDDLTALEQSFYDASDRADAAAERREKRRTQLAWTAAAVMLVLALVAGSVGIYASSQTAEAVHQKAEADKQATLAEANSKEAVSQTAEAQKQSTLAEAKTKEAEANFREGQKTESYFRAEQAKQAGDDAVTAALLALEGLPDSTSVDDAQRTRPFVNEAWYALYGARLRQRERAVLSGHTGVVTSAVFAPDGGRILTASDDGTARLWDRDGKPLGRAPPASAARAGISPAQGRRVARARPDRPAHLRPPR